MLYHAGDSQHTQSIQINKVIGENEKYVFYFMEKNQTDYLLCCQCSSLFSAYAKVPLTVTTQTSLAWFLHVSFYS